MKNLIIVILFNLIGYSVFSQVDCPGGEPCCKIQFCTCCGDALNFTVFYVNGDSLAGNIKTDQNGCTNPGVFSAIAGVSYYVVNDDGCDIPIVYFTGCFCASDSGKQIIKLPCCGDSRGDNKKINHSLPKKFKLDQNFPNPFNPSTTISFELPQAEFVTLTIYDVSGKIVLQAINSKVDAGYHSYIWNVNQKNIASGIYFYKLQAGSFSDEKKMVLVK